MNFKENVKAIIEVKISKNILKLVGDAIELLPDCDVPKGKITNIQKKMIRYLDGIDLRKTWDAARMFRHIIHRETNGAVHLQIIKENGEDLR